MKKEKSVLHLCEGTLLALVILLIMDLYLLKFLQDPEVSYYPMLHLMEAVLALLVVTLALSLIQRELLSRLIVKAFRDITGVHNKTSLEKLVQDLSNRPSTFGVGVMMFDLNNLKYVNDTYGHLAGDELILLEKYGEKAKLLEAVKDVDAIIIRSDVIDAEVLDAAKQLKIVVRAGAGYDNVDLAAATAHNVCVMNTPGQNSNAVAELAFGMMVMAVRNFYNGTSGTELKGKKLGIHAYGNVGRNVARIAKGFGMEIYAFDAFCPASAIEADGVKPVASPEELYATCDIVSLHIPATAETKNSINYALVGKMPKGGLLVNTARKEVINEAELIKLMEERADLKYVTDIMPVANEEFAAKFAGRYFSTPKKMGAQTAEANINAGIAAAKQIEGFLKEGCEKFRVNK